MGTAGATNVQKLRARMERDGVTAFEVWWGPKAKDMTVEERAGVLLQVLDAPRLIGGPPQSGQPVVDVREFVDTLYAESA